MRRTLAACVILVISGCSGASSSSDAVFNDADVEFVQGMIPHHDQAIVMADMVKRGDVSDAVADLADGIRAAQTPEINVMRDLLAEWGKEEDSHAMHMSGDHSMHGMMSQNDLDALDMMSGAEFERMWLAMMIEHHEGAVTMSQQVLSDGRDPRVQALADAIIAAQRDEISRMKALLSSS
jgi:uncharacterized protein (DUF305 family)